MYYLYAVLFSIFCCFIESNIKFVDVNRNIYLESHKIKTYSELIVKNTGVESHDFFEIPFKRDLCDKIYSFSAKQEITHELSVYENSASKGLNYCTYRLKFHQPLKSNDTTKVSVNTIFGYRFIPHPNCSNQLDSQSFIFYDDFYVYSIYETETQSTSYHVNKRDVLSYSQEEMVRLLDSKATVGPFSNIHPLASSPFYIIFKYDKPIFVIDKMIRTYQISEWGFISVTEEMWVHNEAAGLKGSYSRLLDNQHDTHSIYEWEMSLPVGAYNIRYRDGLGNISTSSISGYRDNMKITLEPRFPLFGGWKTFYYISYTLPPQSFIYKDISDSNKRHFLFEVLGSPMEDFLVKSVETRILLPEGATNVDLKYHGVQFKSVTQYLSHSYLDFYGRPSISFSLDNGCSEKNIEIDVSYFYQDLNLVWKPIIVSLAFFALFFIIHTTAFLKFPVLSDETTETGDKLFSIINHIRSNIASLRELYSSHMMAVCNFKLEKKLDHLNAILKPLLTKIEEQKASLAVSLKSLAELDGKYKLGADEVSLKCEERHKNIKKYMEYSKQLVSGEMSREQYTKTAKPIEDMVQELNSLIDKISGAF